MFYYTIRIILFIFIVLDAEDETTVIGYLTVSVTALQVLTSLLH